MGEKPATIWDLFRSRGYSRREFLRFCAAAAAAAGIDASGLPAVVEALETKPRPPMVWLHFQECTCCSESFIRSSHPMIAEILLDRISLDYTQTLQAASGARAEESLRATMKNHAGEYICLVEGAIPVKDGGIYCTIAGRTALDIVREAAAGAKAVIAWGSCASNGCIQAASPNPTGATARARGRPADRDQRPGLSAHRRRHERGRRPPPGLRAPSGARRRRPADGLLLEARPRHLLSPPVLRRRAVRRDLRRRERPQGLLPVQDGLPGPRHLQLLRRHPLEPGRELPHPIGPPLHRMQRGPAIGTSAGSTPASNRSPASGSRRPPTGSGVTPPPRPRAPWPSTPSRPISGSGS